MNEATQTKRQRRIFNVDTELSVHSLETQRKVLACEKMLNAPSVRSYKAKAIERGRVISELAAELDPALFSAWLQLRSGIVPRQADIYRTIYERFGSRRDEVVRNGLHCVDLALLAFEPDDVVEEAMECFARRAPLKMFCPAGGAAAIPSGALPRRRACTGPFIEDVPPPIGRDDAPPGTKLCPREMRRPPPRRQRREGRPRGGGHRRPSKGLQEASRGSRSFGGTEPADDHARQRHRGLRQPIPGRISPQPRAGSPI